MAQLLYISGQLHWDLEKEVDFLTTRVKVPDEDDWGDLKQVRKYIKGTLGVKLNLRADSLSVIKWWVDASFSMHNDCRGHTCNIMSL